MTRHIAPDPIGCLSEGWRLYLKEPMLLSGAALLIGIANLLASWIPFANLALGPPLLASLYLMVIRIDRDQPVSLSNLGDGFQYWLPLVIASLLVSVIVALGLILLVIPGIYFALAYGFTTLLIIDRGMEFWPAMESSRRTITSIFFSYLLLAVLLLAALIVGSIPFGLGLLVAVPFCTAAQYCYYKDVVEEPLAEEFTQDEPPPVNSGFNDPTVRADAAESSSTPVAGDSDSTNVDAASAGEDPNTQHDK